MNFVCSILSFFITAPPQKMLWSWSLKLVYGYASKKKSHKNSESSKFSFAKFDQFKVQHFWVRPNITKLYSIVVMAKNNI